MTFVFNNLKACETCEGAGQLIQDEGPMTGYVISCPKCAGDYKTFINQYGSCDGDEPMFYIDSDKGIASKVKEIKDNYLILPNGEEIELLPNPIINGRSNNN